VGNHQSRGTRREVEREAGKVQARLFNQFDERPSPRTEATVNELHDRWLDVLDVELRTRVSCVGKTEACSSDRSASSTWAR
jgi:hypothetical protein